MSLPLLLAVLIPHSIADVFSSSFCYCCRPHCDGSCDNSMHVNTGRVATAVLYCQVLHVLHVLHCAISLLQLA